MAATCSPHWGAVPRLTSPFPTSIPGGLAEEGRSARLIVESWRIEYNIERPYGALGGETPAAYAILLTRGRV
jgi:hypothetical protein